MRVTIFILASALAFGVAFVPAPLCAQTQQTKPKTMAFFGRVESIDSERKAVTVKHGKIAGYAEAGTTEHPLDEEAALKRLRPGDDIRAMVYANDLTLHHIQVVYRSGAEKGKNSKK
jgi:Cu/Ag efflux protein CusF